MRSQNLESLLRSSWDEEPLVELRGPNSPIGLHDRIARLRTFGYLLLGIVFLANTDLSETAPIAITITVAAVLPFVSALLIKRRYKWELLQLIADMVTAVCIVWVWPEYLQLTLMAMVSLATLEAVYSPTRRALLSSSIVLTGIGVATWVADPSATGRTLAITAVILALVGVYGFSIRANIRWSQQDLRAAIHAAGGLTHITDVETTQFDYQGDVEACLLYTSPSPRD